MKNKFRANCQHCGQPVEPGQGDTNKGYFGQWITVHNICPAKEQPVTKSRANTTELHSSLSKIFDEDELLEAGFYSPQEFHDFVAPDLGDR